MFEHSFLKLQHVHYKMTFEFKLCICMETLLRSIGALTVRSDFNLFYYYFTFLMYCTLKIE